MRRAMFGAAWRVRHPAPVMLASGPGFLFWAPGVLDKRQARRARRRSARADWSGWVELGYVDET